MKDFLEELGKAAGADSIIEGELMKRHTTFRVGGPARYFVSASGEEALKNIILLCQKEQVSYYILGNGSNLLVSDQGYDGVMIYMGAGFSEISTNVGILTAGAGVPLAKIAKEAFHHSLAGFEFAAGIPGTLGGAVVMNAGAYRGEMKDILRTVRVMKTDGTIEKLKAEDLDLSYRHSCIPDHNYIVLSAELCLKDGKKDEIRTRIDALAARRKEKQPLEYPSAGSTFKRPEGYFAGKLIEDAGMRGYRFGGAQVSEKHCGFVINREQATAEDIRTLCHNVQEKVKETSGIDLETEVKMVGWD